MKYFILLRLTVSTPWADTGPRRPYPISMTFSFFHPPIFSFLPSSLINFIFKYISWNNFNHITIPIPQIHAAIFYIFHLSHPSIFFCLKSCFLFRKSLILIILWIWFWYLSKKSIKLTKPSSFNSKKTHFKITGPRVAGPKSTTVAPKWSCEPSARPPRATPRQTLRSRSGGAGLEEVIR